MQSTVSVPDLQIHFCNIRPTLLHQLDSSGGMEKGAERIQV